MNLYEAIEHCKEVAKENRNAALEFARVNQYDAARDCVACGEEHEQLAKWLEELERRREQPEVRHGEWVNYSSDEMYSGSWIYTIAKAQCSVCGRWCEQVRDLTGYVDYDFCPQCGAKMGGDKNASD